MAKTCSEPRCSLFVGAGGRPRLLGQKADTAASCGVGPALAAERAAELPEPDAVHADSAEVQLQRTLLLCPRAASGVVLAPAMPGRTTRTGNPWSGVRRPLYVFWYCTALCKHAVFKSRPCSKF